MPQTIYLPENPNSKLVRALAGNYMQALMEKSLQGPREPEAPKNIAGKEFQWLWNEEQGKFLKSDIPVQQRAGTDPKYEGLTIYGTGPDAGKTRRIYPEKGVEPVLPKNWTFRPPNRTKLTLSERELQRKRDATSKLQAMGAETAYMQHGFKVNEDKTLYIDPINNAPVKLPPYHKVMGKRGQIKTALKMGEMWDDSKELMALLKDPEVANNLKLAESDGLWNRVGSKWSNQIQHWMQKKGIGRNSRTATAIARMQRLASEERKTFMGVAVTEMEIRSALGWMPSAGDSLDTMLNKTALMEKEGEQEFRRFLDIYKDVADVSPFYKAFGISRFGNTGANVSGMSNAELLKEINR